jgi:hypothetical protein
LVVEEAADHQELVLLVQILFLALLLQQVVVAVVLVIMIHQAFQVVLVEGLLFLLQLLDRVIHLQQAHHKETVVR